MAALVAQLVKNLHFNSGDLDLILGLGRSSGEGINYPLQYSWASLVAQMVKNLPAMWEAWVWSLGWEDPLEKGKATHSSILTWIFPWTEEPGGLQSMGLQRVGHDWVTNTFTFFLSSWVTYLFGGCIVCVSCLHSWNRHRSQSKREISTLLMGSMLSPWCLGSGIRGSIQLQRDWAGTQC